MFHAKRLICALGLTLGVWGVLTLPAAADHRCWRLPPLHIDAGFKVWFDVRWGQQQQHLGPWYAYFPTEAQQPLSRAQHGAAPGWGVQAPLQGVGPAIPPPAPTFSYGNYGIPPSYWYGAP